MRLTASLAAMCALAIATPAIAQSTSETAQTTGQTSGQSRLDRILGRVVDAVLPPEEQAQTVADTAAQTAMQQVLAHPRRAEDRIRDPYRHPAQTLDFFRIQPGMVVADFMPAGGWYSRVLAPYLGQGGTYIGVDPWLNEQYTGYWDTYRNTPTRFPAQVREWVGDGSANVLGVITNDIPDEMAGTVDRFLIFREMHNIRRSDWTHATMMAARTLLKDDGLVGVVQHRARSNAPVEETFGSKGYMHEADVVAMFALYGFDLVASSPVNDNPADPSDWEIGVWAMPPGMRGADTQAERARRMAMGESDRMTLLFRKRS